MMTPTAPFSYIFDSSTNIIPFCEIILVTSFHNVISIAYSALIEGKFQNPKLAKYARTHAIAEAVDFLLHAIAFCGAIYYIPELIPLLYAVSHLFTSLSEIGIRWQLAGFMLKGIRKYSSLSHAMLVGCPYLLRALFVTAASITSSQHNYAINMPCVLIGELIMLMFDVGVVEYTHMLRLTGRLVPLSEYIAKLVHPTHSIMLVISTIGIILCHIGYYVNNIQYVTAVGTCLLMPSYYVYKQFITKHVEGWVLAENTNGTGSVGKSGANRSQAGLESNERPNLSTHMLSSKDLRKPHHGSRVLVGLPAEEKAPSKNTSAIRSTSTVPLS